MKCPFCKHRLERNKNLLGCPNCHEVGTWLLWDELNKKQVKKENNIIYPILASDYKCLKNPDKNIVYILCDTREELRELLHSLPEEQKSKSAAPIYYSKLGKLCWFYNNPDKSSRSIGILVKVYSRMSGIVYVDDKGFEYKYCDAVKEFEVSFDEN